TRSSSRTQNVFGGTRNSPVRSIVSPRSQRTYTLTVTHGSRLFEQRTAGTLGFYDDGCSNMDGVITLTRFPIRHPNATVRCRFPGQITLVQSVAWRELDKVGHWCAYEMGM